MFEPIGRRSLVNTAHRLGRTDTDERTIEYLCRQGVLPHAQRVHNVVGGWSYPALAPHQLERYLELRDQGLSLKVSRFVLWLDGYEVDPEAARDSLVEYGEKAAQRWEHEVARYATVEDFVEEVATTLSSARSRSPLPRVVRQTQDERRQAYEWLAGLMVGRSGSDSPGVEAFERAIGRRNHQGMLYPEFADEASFNSGLDGPYDLPSQLAASRSASAAEMELTRRTVHFQIVYGSALVKAFAWETKSAAPFFQLAQSFLVDDLTLTVGLVAAMLARLAQRRDRATYEIEVAQHTAALEPGRIGLELLQTLPLERRAFLTSLPKLDRALIALELRRRQSVA